TFHIESVTVGLLQIKSPQELAIYNFPLFHFISYKEVTPPVKQLFGTLNVFSSAIFCELIPLSIVLNTPPVANISLLYQLNGLGSTAEIAYHILSFVSSNTAPLQPERGKLISVPVLCHVLPASLLKKIPPPIEHTIILLGLILEYSILTIGPNPLAK